MTTGSGQSASCHGPEIAADRPPRLRDVHVRARELLVGHDELARVDKPRGAEPIEILRDNQRRQAFAETGNRIERRSGADRSKATPRTRRSCGQELFDPRLDAVDVRRSTRRSTAARWRAIASNPRSQRTPALRLPRAFEQVIRDALKGRDDDNAWGGAAASSTMRPTLTIRSGVPTDDPPNFRMRTVPGVYSTAIFRG